MSGVVQRWKALKWYEKLDVALTSPVWLPVGLCMAFVLAFLLGCVKGLETLFGEDDYEGWA